MEIVKRELPAWFRNLYVGKELIDQAESQTKAERQARLDQIRALEAAHEKKILALRAAATQTLEKAKHDMAVAEASQDACRHAEYVVTSVSIADMTEIENLRYIQRTTGDPDDLIRSLEYEMEARFDAERRIPAITHQIETGEYFRVSGAPVYRLLSDLESRNRRLAAIRRVQIEAREVVIYEALLPHELKKRLDDLRNSLPEVCIEEARQMPSVSYEKEPPPLPVTGDSRSKTIKKQFALKES